MHYYFTFPDGGLFTPSSLALWTGISTDQIDLQCHSSILSLKFMRTKRRPGVRGVSRVDAVHVLVGMSEQ